MAEYNPSKIIKDGNTYNFRDTTKIPLAGSNEISGSLIPSADGTVNLGSPSYQWNNAYIKSLTINGVAAGDILTHNVSEFVDVSTAQSVGGVKTFTGYVIFNPYRVQIKNSSQELGVVPASNQWNGIGFTDKNNSSTFSIEQAFLPNGNTMVHFSMTPNITSGSLLRIFESMYYASTDTIETKSRTLVPDKNNSRDLGTSTYKWKSFNGINPGALSLPSASSGINLDLTNFKTDGSDNKFRLTSFSNYPYDNGWLFVRLNGCTSYYLDHWYKVVSDSCATPSEAIFFLPINDKDHDITLRCVCTSINYIRIFPCQGNV